MERRTELTGTQELFLDVFRIIAALMVLFGHSFSFYNLTFLGNGKYFLYIQDLGVVMLFLLSGFLTAFSIDKKCLRGGGYKYSDFVKHRWIRIMKEFIPGLFIITIVDYITLRFGICYEYIDNYNLLTFIENLLFLNGTIFNRLPILSIEPFGTGRPLWTLAIEWWFYMIYGCYYLVIKKKAIIDLKTVALFIAVTVIPCEYLIGGRGGGLGFVFTLGILSYYWYEKLEKSTAIAMLFVSIPLLVAIGAYLKNAYTILIFFAMTMIFCSLVRITLDIKNGVRHKTIMMLSRSTFVLYLIHYSIIYLICGSNMNVSVERKFAIGIVLSMCISFGIYYIFGQKDLFHLIYIRLNEGNKKIGI